MSVEAITSCWGADFPIQAEGIGTAMVRLVALAVADVVNDTHDNLFYAKRRSMATKVGCDPDTVGDVLKHLVASGVMEVVRADPGRPVEYRWLRRSQGQRPQGVRSAAAGVAVAPPQHNPKGTQEDVPPMPPKGGRRVGKQIPRIVPSLVGDDERSEDFEAFWNLYPRSLEGNDARRAWLQVFDQLPDQEALLAAVVAMTVRVQREHPNDPNWRKWCKYPAVWLRKGCWDDERPEPVVSAAEVAHFCQVCGLNPIGDASGCLIVVKERGDLDACPWRQS